nr:beta-ketoacyl-[acyl-carrier-protein] synthase family protein [Brevibacillus fulvus]
MVTGIGTINPIGGNVQELWEGLLTGKSGVKRVKSFDVSGHQNKNGCEIDTLREPVLFETGRTMGRATRIFMLALEEAVCDAGLSAEELARERTGLSIGTTMGEIEPLEAALMNKGKGVNGGPHAIAENVADTLKLSGPVWTITNACAAGNVAIARAMEELLANRADIMIVGGVDAFSWAAFTGFSSLRAMTPDLCRPFDIHRQGLILGEGAGVLLLERQEHLLRRGHRPRARLMGYGLSCDAHHITQPDPAARSAISSIESALKMAQLDKASIGYVSAHGTGTPANDRMEAKALKAVFGETTPQLPVSSIKGHIGHTLGAASAIEAVVCVKALETGILPPTLNLREQDPECDINVIANEPLCKPVEYILSNAYAFGGINSSIVIGKTKEN